MKELRFEGRTAVVTGAGGNPGLGRAHALLLASRGANVVVNDVGALPESLGYSDAASAEAVVQEIRALGGRAVADTHSVGSEEGARAIVQTALDAFGGIDILINNAGVCRVVSFEEMTPRDFRHSIEVNLFGTVATCRAAWPHMKAGGYGRIVNVTSGSLAGYAWQSAYAASKGAVFSFTRVLAVEGAEHGIRANTVAPGAFTRMVTAAQEEDSPYLRQSRDRLPPELVSPAVAFLAHESCPLSGECVEAVGGRLGGIYLARTPGVEGATRTIESVAEHWREAIGGTSEGLMDSQEADPREWHPKPYVPLG